MDPRGIGPVDCCWPDKALASARVRPRVEGCPDPGCIDRYILTTVSEQPDEQLVLNTLASVTPGKWARIWEAAEQIAAEDLHATSAGGGQVGTIVVDGEEAPVFELGYPVYSASVEALRDALAEAGLIVPFDWIGWQGAGRYRSGVGMPEAPVVDAVWLITAIFRSERFSDGAIETALDDGTLPAALARLRTWFDGELALGAALVWKVLYEISTCAVACIGDPRLLTDDRWRSQPLPYLRVRRSGYGMLYATAETDGLPVEVGYRSGQIVAVRLEFTDDVADLEAAGEGAWTRFGSVRIGSKGTVASGIEGVDQWTVEVPLPEGRYVGEVFSTPSDDLGIRLVPEPSTDQPRSSRASRKDPLPAASQLERREVMRSRTLARLDGLAVEARSSDFTVGKRVRQPSEVQRLQRRVRQVTARWAPRWTSHAASQAAEEDRVQLEHVVPVVVLTERILLGDDVEAVLGQASICRVTYDEHKLTLQVAFRRVHRELYDEMLRCPLEQLGELGWQRYRLVGLDGCFEL